MALPKVTEPIAGQWPVSVAWRGWLESLDRRLTILANTETPAVTFPDPPQLVQGEGINVYGAIGWGQVATLSLRLLADTGAGTFQKITRDDYGRVSGAEPVTPADMLNPFATYLVDGNGDYLTDADGNFLVSDDGTLVQDSITDGVTDKAPSQNAVFDALALKANDSAVVKLTGNQTIAGAKTFSEPIVLGPAGGEGGEFTILAQDSSYGGFFDLDASNHMRFFSAKTGSQLRFWPDSTLVLIVSQNDVFPAPDNSIGLGAAAQRWREVYAGNAVINTSDAREKTAPRDMVAAEHSAALDIARLPCIFRWLHAIESKGEGARLHASPTVQSVIAVMRNHGLDPFRYGFVCYDQWDESPEVIESWEDQIDGDGNVISPAGSRVSQPHIPAGDRYSLRQGELAAFIMRALVKRQDDIEARLAALGG